jgi:NHLM bacteriocin system ABC transporter ATP-binding protein
LPSHPVGLLDLLRFALRGQSVAAAILILISVLTAGLGLLMPWAMGHLIETLLPAGDQDQLRWMTLGLSGIAIGAWLLGLYQYFVSLRMGVWMDVATHSAAWDRLLKLPAGFFRHYSAGDLAARVNGIAAIRQQVSGVVLAGLLHGLFVIFTVMLMAAYSVPLTLLAVGMVSVAVAITLAGGMRIVKYEREVSEQAGQLSGWLLQWLNGITKLRGSGTEDRAFAQWQAAFTRQQTNALHAATWRNSLHSAMGLLTLFSLVAIVTAVSVGGWATHLTTSQFFVFNATFALFTASMLALSNMGLGLLSIVPWYERAQVILHTPLERRGGLSVELDGSIEIDQVYFAYGADQSPIVRDVTVHIAPGECVAIVGASGCGKTTLLRLLLGFEQPTSGQIRYNGHDLTTIDVAELRRQLGVVLQNGQLIEGDIGSNIIGGRPFTIAEAWQAARVSAVAAEIAALPMGMNTILNDRAATLSSGQRQRLLLARALVHQPRILLLDEATSSLDHPTQAQIMRNLRQLRVTTLFIAHRFSTLVDADRILVLEKGVIVEQGNYSELLAKQGVFAQWVQPHQ